MAFIRTIPVAEVSGDARAMYENDLEKYGFVPNYTAAFSMRPDVMNAFGTLIRTISGNMDFRRYELVTLATAMALECSYCSLAHGQVLREQFFDAEQMEAIARDFRHSDLTPADKAMMAFAQKIALRARAITQADVDELRGHGFSDQDIFDIAAAAAGRCFMSKLLDAVGSEPDHIYADLEPGLRQALTVGRDIEKPPAK